MAQESPIRMARRFVFRGNASPVSGLIMRPDRHVLESSGASSLTVVGGLSRGRLDGMKIGGFGLVRSATTEARGEFGRFRPQSAGTAPAASGEDGERASEAEEQEDLAREREFSSRGIAEEEMPTRTLVQADVRGVELALADDAGRQIPLEIGHLHVTLAGVSPAARAAQPNLIPIRIAIEGVRIGGEDLRIETDGAEGPFAEYTTGRELVAAIDDGSFTRKHRARVVQGDESFEPPPGRFVVRGKDDTVYGSLVKGISWPGIGNYPGAAIKGHVIYIPGVGYLYFGEVLVSDGALRVTACRADLGSPLGGRMAFAEVETNGTWYPP